MSKKRKTQTAYRRPLTYSGTARQQGGHRCYHHTAWTERALNWFINDTQKPPIETHGQRLYYLDNYPGEIKELERAIATFDKAQQDD